MQAYPNVDVNEPICLKCDKRSLFAAVFVHKDFFRNTLIKPALSEINQSLLFADIRSMIRSTRRCLRRFRGGTSLCRSACRRGASALSGRCCDAKRASGCARATCCAIHGWRAIRATSCRRARKLPTTASCPTSTWSSTACSAPLSPSHEQLDPRRWRRGPQVPHRPLRQSAADVRCDLYYL